MESFFSLHSVIEAVKSAPLRYPRALLTLQNIPSMDEAALMSLSRTRGGTLLLRALRRSESNGDLTLAALKDTLTEESLALMCEHLALACRGETRLSMEERPTMPQKTQQHQVSSGANKRPCSLFEADDEPREEGAHLCSPGKRSRQGLLRLSQNTQVET